MLLFFDSLIRPVDGAILLLLLGFAESFAVVGLFGLLPDMMGLISVDKQGEALR